MKNLEELPKTQKEAKLLGEKYYFTGMPCSKGHISKRQTSSFSCVTCRNDYQREKYHVDLVKSRERVRTKQNKLYQINPAKFIKESKKTRDKLRDTNEYRINNLARLHRVKAKQVNRLPAWLTEDDFWIMKEAHILAHLRTQMFGFPWEVDHILPLNGKYISGLHVPNNLQVITRRENKMKHNNFQPS